MITNIYTLFDVKAAVYGTPFFMPNDQMSIRAMKDLVADEGTIACRHPEDFDLRFIGTYDDSTGTLHREPMRVVTTASACKVVPRSPRLINLEEVPKRHCHEEGDKEVVS